MMTLKQLSHALALQRYGNFHRAANAENISQSALSRSIRTLEEGLGVVLFDREGAAVTPTLFGNALLQRAGKVFSETDELQREIQLLRGLDAGCLKIATGAYAGELSAMQAVGDLIKRYPKIRCRLQLTSWKGVADLVLSNEVDLGVGESSMLDKNNELQVVPLGAHRLVFFCRPGHPLARRKRVTKAMLDDFPAVTVRLPPRVADVFPGNCQIDKETGGLIPAVEVDDLVSARHIVSSSNAFGVAAPVQIDPWLRRGEYRILSFNAPWLKLNYGFIYLRNRMLSPAAMVYMELAQSIEKKLDAKNRALIEQYLG
jgi:DNA-binding transcriptional LysR family regulator